MNEIHYYIMLRDHRFVMYDEQMNATLAMCTTVCIGVAWRVEARTRETKADGASKRATISLLCNHFRTHEAR